MIHTQINHYSIVYHNTLMLRIDYRRWLNKFMFNNIILFNKLISHCAHAFYSVSFCAILWWCCDLMFLNLFPFIPPFAVHHFLCIPRSCYWKFRQLRMLGKMFENPCWMWGCEGEVRRKFHIMVMWKFSFYWKILIHPHCHFFLLIISLFVLCTMICFPIDFLCSTSTYVLALSSITNMHFMTFLGSVQKWRH